MKRPITIDDLYQIVTVEDPRISPDGKWIVYVRVTIDKFKNEYQRTLWVVSTDGGEPIQLTRHGKESTPHWSPHGHQLAFVSTRDNHAQIYLLPIASPGGEPRQLTKMPNGASNPAWSPDGKMIAFLAGLTQAERDKEDQAEAEPPPVDELEAKHRQERRERDEKLRTDPRTITQLPYREETSFLSARFRQIYVISTEDSEKIKPRRLTNLDTHYSAPYWTPDGKTLITARSSEPAQDEPWRFSSIYKIDLESGEETRLTDDSHTDSNPQPSLDGKWIAYLRFPTDISGRALARLAVIPADGGTPHDLSLPLDRAADSFVWSENRLFFTVPTHGNVHIYSVDPVSGTIENVVGGTLEVQSLDANHGLAYNATTPTTPPEIFWRAADETVQLTHHNQKFLDEIIVQAPQELWYKSPDGTDVQGWYLLPEDYQAGQQYPLIVSIHGGPHLMYGAATRTMWHEWHVQAARGYVVFFCNPRGSDGYGAKFRDGIFQAWGTNDMPDQMAGIDALVAKGFVDSNRIAITGGSYGGFMTTWMISHSDRFCAAVSQRGVYHLMSFYGSTDIPGFVQKEHGVEPWEDPQALWQQSPVAHVHQINTPLLILHAENDYRVPIVDAELLYALLRRMGKTVKFVRFPRDGHEMSRSGEPLHRISRLTLMMEWFDTYCLKSTTIE